MPSIEYHYVQASGMELILSSKKTMQYPWHIHARHWTLGLVLAGAALWETKNSKRQLGEGEYFVACPCEVHRLRIEPETSLATLCIDAASLGHDVPGSLAVMLQAFYAAHSHASAAVTHAVARLQSLGSPFAPYTASAHDNCGGQTPAQKIMRQLADNPEQPFSIAEMAALAGCSRWHFLRCFQKETGMTPHAFQLACRLRQARRLLRKRTAASTAAVSAGFADQSHMHKVFTRHHGMTPRQFLQASFMLEP